MSVISGQLLRLKFFEGLTAVTLTDLIAIILCVYSVIYFLAIKKSLKLTGKTVVPASIFTLIAIGSNVIATLTLPPKDVLVSSLFLVRFFALFFISQIVINTVKKREILNWVNLIVFFGSVFIFLGFLQLIFYPDLTSLVAYGWDPHQKRIVSTFLDPNFAGFVYVMIFTLTVSFLLFKESLNLKTRKIYLSVAFLSTIATLLTFSRSSYLAFLTSIFILGAVKSTRLFFLMIIFLIILSTSIPQARQRIIGALTFDETSRARVESWQNAFYIFSKNPVFGVGFNTYRFTQARLDLFDKDSPLGGHSGAGTDSSILLVAATTGSVGAVLFLSLLAIIIKSLAQSCKKGPISLAAFAITIALLVHSQFVNSFFYPQIMVLFWFTIGLSQTQDV